MSNGTIIIIALVVAWITQLGMSLLQMRRFHRRMAELRKLGRASVGLAGGTYKGKVYTVIVLDDDDQITHAEKLSGITVFANLKPVPQVVGMSLEDLLLEEPQARVSKKAWESFRNAANHFFPEDETDESLEGEEQLD
ncbi:MAG: transcriptional regulator GutM [Chloroflexota bacterium]